VAVLAGDEEALFRVIQEAGLDDDRRHGRPHENIERGL